MRTARRLAPVLVLAAALAGCPPRAPPPDLSLDPAALAEQVRAAQARTRSVRGEVRVKVESAEASGTVPALVAAEKPDRLLVQTLDFFGNTVAVLSAAGGELSLYDARAQVVYRGPATPENLRRLVPVPLAPAELAEILCGSAPLLAGEAVAADAGKGHVTLRLEADGRTQALRVGAGAEVLRSELRAGGARAPGTYDLLFEGFDRFEGIRFPAEVTLSAEAPRVRLRLVWVDVEPNAALEAKLFAPRIPAGARVVDLSRAAPPAGLFPDAASNPPPKPAE
jgi:outer membrane lipoprotein-sorting protein